MKPGPNIGNILNALLEEVLDDPSKNTTEYLDAKTNELLQLSDAELKKLGDSGKKKQEEAEDAEIKKIQAKNNVL